MHQLLQHDLIRLSIFSCDLIDINNEQLIDEIDEYHKIVDPHAGGKLLPENAPYEDTLFPHDGHEAQNLINKVISAVSSIANNQMQMQSVWTSLLHAGQSVSMHSHRSNTHMFPMEYFSFAYYAQAEEDSAQLIFNTSFCNIIEQSYLLSPHTGMLVIFNSFISHMTSRHLGLLRRIVVSGNLCPVTPNITPIPDWSGYSA